MNPELALIDAIVEQIVDDERLIEGLGDGSLALEDVERWHRRRVAGAARFEKECGSLIAAMRSQGFGRMMRRPGPPASARRGVSSGGARRARTAGRSARPSTRRSRAATLP